MQNQLKKDKGDELADRLLDYTVRIIKLVKSLPNTIIGKHIGGQLLRSGTSPGSNYEESRGAESRADFIHKLGIVLKELKETRFWLKVVLRSEILEPERVEPLIQESMELCAIIAKSIVTAKKNR
ncbi:MAG: four helix bundle protein [Nitrospira sp.]|nr:four helix bundle protein [Nitrospira sp.]